MSVSVFPPDVSPPKPGDPVKSIRRAISAVPVLPRTVDQELADLGRFFLFVNGINQRRNAFTSWHLTAEEYIESSRTPKTWRADTFSYFAGITARWFTNQRLITACCQKLTRRQRDLGSDEVIAVGHSNGCAILCGTLRENPDLKIHELHLIAGAETADCDKNGLNAAIARGKVDRVICHCSTSDEWLGKGGFFGFGDIGKAGPANVRSNKIRTVWYPGFRHSDYFEDEHYYHLMGRVINRGDDLFAN